MENEEIIKKFKIAGFASSCDWDFYMEIHERIVNKSLDWIDLKYSDAWKNDYREIRKDILDRKLWSTYKDCIYITLDSKMIMQVTCWDGRLTDGSSTEKRWEGSIQLQETDLNYFKDSIEHQFKKEIDHRLRQIEAQERLDRLKQLETEILNEIEL